MKTNLNRIVLTGILLALTVVFQYTSRFFSQYVTGSAVNAMLFLTTAIVGTWSGVIVGCFTPIVALTLGIMGRPEMVPFIAIGNGLLCLVYGFLRKVNELAAYLVSVVVKFVWLAFSVRYLVSLFGFKAPAPLIQMMTFPQLITGLLGAVVAFSALTVLQKHLNLKRLG